MNTLVLLLIFKAYLFFPFSIYNASCRFVIYNLYYVSMFILFLMSSGRYPQGLMNFV